MIRERYCRATCGSCVQSAVGTPSIGKCLCCDYKRSTCCSSSSLTSFQLIIAQTCADDPGVNCASYKSIGYCQSVPSIQNTYCPVSCGACIPAPENGGELMITTTAGNKIFKKSPYTMHLFISLHLMLLFLYVHKFISTACELKF